MNVIKTGALKIAREIGERRLLNPDDAAIMIEVIIRDMLPLIVAEYANDTDEKYNTLKQKCAKAFGTKDYIKLGYELAAMKSKKASANRAMNDLLRKDKYNELRKWVEAKYGPEVIQEFHGQSSKVEMRFRRKVNYEGF